MDIKQYRDTTGLGYVLGRMRLITPFAKDIINNLTFYENQDELEEEMDRIRFIRELDTDEAEKKLDSLFSGIKDITRSIENMKKGQRLTLEELFELKNLLMAMEEIAKVWEDESAKNGGGMYQAIKNMQTWENGGGTPEEARRGGKTVLAPGLFMYDVSEPLAVLDPEGERKKSFMIPDAASERLSEIRNKKRAMEKQLLSGEGSVRNKWNELCLEEDAEEKEQCLKICRKLSPYADCMLENNNTLGRFELLLCKAKMDGSSIPSFGTGQFVFEEMHNPQVEDLLSQKEKAYVAATLAIGRGATVITGANMGGKSVALKTVVLNTVLAMTGFPVFCKKAALPMVKEVALISGYHENMEEGLSAFAGEMDRIKNCLDSRETERLVILDEPALGTNPKEGAAIVKGITEYLNKQATYSVIATHFDGVAALADSHYRIKNFSMEKTGPDEPVPNEAVNICRKTGFNGELLEMIAKNT